MRFKDFLIREDMMGGPPGGGMPPPGGDPMGGGMPPMGGAGGPPPGGPAGGPPGGDPMGGGMGGPGGPGGAPGGGLDPQKNLQMQDTDVWGTLEKLLGGKSEPKKGKASQKPDNMLQQDSKHLLA